MRRPKKNELLPQFYASHFDEVLGDLGHALLAFVNREIRPVQELLVDLECPVGGWDSMGIPGEVDG